MQMAIIQNPHVKEPKTLWDEINKQESQLNGKNYLDSQIDLAGLDMLKSKMSNNPRIKVK